jgi:hypothetical protein
VTVLTFVPKPKPQEIDVAAWEVELVLDLIEFCYDHHIVISLDEAVAHSQAIAHGQEVVYIRF